jgi:hypothetical protein
MILEQVKRIAALRAATPVDITPFTDLEADFIDAVDDLNWTELVAYITALETTLKEIATAPRPKEQESDNHGDTFGSGYDFGRYDAANIARKVLK